VVVLELLTPEQKTISALDKPILNELQKEKNPGPVK
jgi:hypothetical protein